MSEVKSLDVNIKKYWVLHVLIKTGIWTALCSIAILSYFLWLSDWVVILYGAGALLAFRLIFTVFFTIKGVNIQYSRYHYRLEDDEIFLEFGTLFSRSTTIIPMNRVQHVDTMEGVLLRKYGLVELGVNTAGDAYTVQGLTPQIAEEIRRFIIEAAKLEEDDDAYKD